MRIIKKILIVFIILVISSLALLYLNDLANQNVVVTKYEFNSDKIPSSFYDTKFMVISDLHDADFSKQITEHIKKEKPDYVVMTGDMVQLPDHSIENTLKIANEVIKMDIPIYAVSGNHDRQCGEYYSIVDVLWANDVYLLENGSVKLEKDGDEILLVGIKDPRHDIVTEEKLKAICGNIEHELSKADADTFSILLSHRADLYPDIKDTGVDLILSGHMHGGIIRLPFIGGIIGENKENSLFPSYTYGEYKEGEATMIVSGGCDKNPKKRRFFNPPEVLVITLQGE